MSIHNLGPVECYECSVCQARHVGPADDKQTRKWKARHNRAHRQSHRGVWYWDEDQ